jgi:hypothetical protein
MEIGTAIIIASTVLGIVAVIFRLFPKANGFSVALCAQKHIDVDRRLDRQERDRSEILDYLRRIEGKLDDHIAEAP